MSLIVDVLTLRCGKRAAVRLYGLCAHLASLDSLRHVSPLTPEDVLKVLPGLFWDHDCVMLPGMGGFVIHVQPGMMRPNSNRPPSRDVLFNEVDHQRRCAGHQLMAKHILSMPLGGGRPGPMHSRRRMSPSFHTARQVVQEEDGQLRFMADAEFERMLWSFGHAAFRWWPAHLRLVAAPSWRLSRPKPRQRLSRTQRHAVNLSRKDV